VGLEEVRRWAPALASVFICTISFSDMSLFGIGGRSGVSAVGKAGVRSEVGLMRASGEACWKECEFLRMPLESVSHDPHMRSCSFSIPLGLLGASGGECGVGDETAISFM